MKIVYRSDDPDVRKALKKRAKRVVALHGGIAEMCRVSRPPAADDDETHVRINRSGLKDYQKEFIAKMAREKGLSESSAYDPCIPGGQVYETRAQADAAVARACAKGEAEGDRPLYRLHPEIVERERRRRIATDPSQAHRDQRELREEIIETHGLPE
jgi:hypothetical protein